MYRLCRASALGAYLLCATLGSAQTRVRHDQIKFGTTPANQVLASPNDGSGAPAFRPIKPEDIPPLTQSKVENLATDLAAKYGSGAHASLSAVTVTPAVDSASGTFRRFGALQTNPVLGIQTENGTWIGYFDAIGRVNFPGQTDGCATWSNGVLNSTGSPCGSGGGGTGSGAGGTLNTVQVHGPGGISTGYEEITIDPITKQLSVPSLRITGPGVGVMRLASGPEPSGRAGAGTVFSESGEILSFKPGTGTKKQIAMMGGHLSGTQTDPNVSSFSLMSNGSLGGKALTVSCANENVTGTTLKLLATRSTTGDTCVKADTTDIGVPVYIVTSGAGTTGSAELAESGRDLCTFDNAGAIGNYVVASTLTAGRCHAVAVPAANDWVIGQLTTPVSGAGVDGTVHVSAWVKSGSGGGLSDPGNAGIIKRTALNTTAPATACTDYYAPGCAIDPADLPPLSGGGLSDPGNAGIIKRTALNTTAPATTCTDYYAPGCAIDPADLPPSSGGGLSDPGNAGIIKRTALNTTAPATTCTDYYAPGCAIDPADLPPSSGGGVALKTLTFSPVSTISNDGSTGINGCPGGTCSETAFTQNYLIPAGSLVAGKRYRLTVFGNAISSTSGNPTYTMRVKAASSTAIASGTTILTMPNIAMTAGCSNCTGGATIMITGTAAAASSSPVYASPVGNSLVAVTGSSGRNSLAQPINVATNADIYLGLTIQWSNSNVSASFILYDFIVEELR